MYLSTVEIKNFRSLKDLRADLQPGLNVVVGRNNTGKTNLLHAIRHALGPSASRGDSLWLDQDDFYREAANAEPAVTIAITLTFTGLSPDQRAYFFEIVDFDLTDIANSKAIIRFEASWPKGKARPTIKRTGGPPVVDPPEVPARILESLPITFLPALRDAEAALAPGVQSRLARLLRDLAERKYRSDEQHIKEVFAKANEALEAFPLISETKKSLRTTTNDIAGNDYRPPVIRAAQADFDRILRSLQVQMDDAPIGGLDANGLGYNNLLYIAVVLEHLKSPDEEECPLLLVEEPEAHLHPQLTMLLADYLANKTPAKGLPQTIVTTHSPTLAANSRPGQILVMYADPTTRCPHCNSIVALGMSKKEQDDLQRMMDITRATLYFAKGAILVEGISEALLIPVLAKRLGIDLTEKHISVIPICGVAFETFKKLLHTNALGIPAAIVTDADPPVTRGATWEQDLPQPGKPPFDLSDRTKKLMDVFSGHQTVKVFSSHVTLEYDLAEAGDENATVMAEAWESCFYRKPGTFNVLRVSNAGACRHDRALAAWRGICLAEPTVSKADFAHRLAACLAQEDAAGNSACAFEVPDYLRCAIEYVAGNAPSPTMPAGAGSA